MNRSSTGIAPEGFGIILVSALLGWIFSFIDYGYISLLFILFTFFNIYFFRDPERSVTSGKGEIVSPADGKVVEVTEESETYFLNEDRIRVSIFLSILDCHVNRFPVGGRVLSTSYREGGYGLAYKPDASSRNERLATLIETGNGVRIVMVQIAGLIARRIVSYADVDTVFNTGERFGIIKYGSRVDLFLPLSSEMKVKAGDKVRAGETILACLNEEKE